MTGVFRGQDSFSQSSTEYTVDYKALANATYKHDANIVLKSAGHDTCYITSIKKISTDKLFLVECYGSCKIFDVTKEREISSCGLNGYLWDAAILPDDTVALTSQGSELIHFISTENDTPKLQYSVSTRSPCYGIAYRNGKLAVSFSGKGALPSRIEVRNMSGIPYLVSTFTDNNPGIPLNCPRYIVFDDSDHMFVTDVTTQPEFERLSVVKYSLDGEIKQAYKGWELSAYGAGICCAGQAGVFICDEKNDCIRLLSPDLGSSKVVLDANDGICKPQAVCYCEVSGRLFVSIAKENSRLKVFSVKEN